MLRFQGIRALVSPLDFSTFIKLFNKYWNHKIKSSAVPKNFILFIPITYFTAHSIYNIDHPQVELYPRWQAMDHSTPQCLDSPSPWLSAGPNTAPSNDPHSREKQRECMTLGV